ncbi:MAG: class I SAM-dependent methyltransferase, partial [Nanoarchaeota archaeon]|nr:class I SAM-dependent methyltransferase [Nanoarchaeota archaeon]
MDVKEELKKEYLSGKLPELTNRLNSQEISIHPCFNCLRETENAINKGYWKEFPKPLYYWYEMCDAESKEITKFLKDHKPKKILELGCGSGRIINILLKDNTSKDIFAVDKDKRMVEIVKPYFKDKKNVHIINQDVRDFLEKNGNFDLALTMMNTFGNIDSLEIMKLVAKHSKNLLFTVYDRKYWKERKVIYEDRGHVDFSIKDKDYYF